MRDDQGERAGWRPAIHIIMPTFHRDDRLRRSLHKLSEQACPPTSVVVVDNAGRSACERVCQELRGSLPFDLQYLPTSSNLGPAGATAIAMERLLPGLDDDDFIGRSDDDARKVGPGHLERLTELLLTCEDLTSLGGIGPNGARWDRGHARFTEPVGSTGTWLEVDYLATGYLPLFRVAAIRRVGVFRTDLFFGLTEAEYGLRLRSHGYRLLAVDSNPPSPTDRNSRSNAAQGPTWRSYYSARNRVVIAREFGSPLAPLRVVVELLLGPLVRHWRRPHIAAALLRWNVRAIRDAVGGRMGRTVEPEKVGGRLDLRSASRPLHR